jgi:hypothetical protein
MSIRPRGPVCLALLLLLSGAAAASAQGMIVSTPLTAPVDAVGIEAMGADKEANERRATRLRMLPLAQQCEAQLPQTLDDDQVSVGCGWGRLRLLTAAQADSFFGGLAVGRSIGVSVGEDQASLYTELLSDNLFLSQGLGYARMGMSIQASSAKDDEEVTTVDQFFQAGGNAILWTAVPLSVWHNFRVTSPTERVPFRHLTSLATLGLAADVPELNSAENSEGAASARLGVQGDFSWGTNRGIFGLFAHADAGLVQGLTGTFYSNLTGDEDRHRVPFLAGSAVLGIDMSKLVRVGVRFSHTTLPGVSQRGARVSVQLLSQK